jgi:hypothetical protein
MSPEQQSLLRPLHYCLTNPSGACSPTSSAGNIDVKRALLASVNSQIRRSDRHCPSAVSDIGYGKFILQHCSTKWFSSVLKHQYTGFVGYMFRFVLNHLKTNVNYRELNSVCTNSSIMGSHSVHIKIITILKMYKFKITNLKSVDRMR